MELAVEKAKEGITKGQAPFGSLIVKAESLIATAHNTVWHDRDPIAHAEINAIRIAAKKLGSIELTGCTLYSTCEPCPMCLSAIHWSKIDRIVYGATIEDASNAGFKELFVSARELVRLGKSPLRVDCLVDGIGCQELFGLWKKNGLSKSY